MRASDVMNPVVITIPHDTPLREVIRTLTEHNISGAPVVDGDGKLAGVVSYADIVATAEQGAAVQTRGLRFHRDLWCDLEDEWYQKTVLALDETLTARDLMTPEAFQVGEDARVRDVADMMVTRRIHRVIVTDDDRIKGIITTVDLVRQLVACLPEAIQA